MSLLIGGADTPEKRRYREALMTSQVREIYADYYRRYRREHEDRLAQIARESPVCRTMAQGAKEPGRRVS